MNINDFQNFTINFRKRIVPSAAKPCEGEQHSSAAIVSSQNTYVDKMSHFAFQWKMEKPNHILFWTDAISFHGRNGIALIHFLQFSLSFGKRYAKTFEAIESLLPLHLGTQHFKGIIKH